MHAALAHKYIDRYACEEARILPNFFNHGEAFQLATCLPIYGESLTSIERLLETFSELSRNVSKPHLLVGVINQGPNPPRALSFANQSLIARVRANAQKREGIFFLETFSKWLTILWVDRASGASFKEKQGVGLARKIGCDILCSLIVQKQVQTPWLWTTDADAVLPSDYFTCPSSEAAALHYTFRHDLDGFEGEQALLLYEIHLRHYFLGLNWAGSPYSYPSIGSCLAINPEAYIKVRGFQDRMAGEDFHLLNKLRKTGPILYRRGNPIHLEGRFSDRVPFGTGKSTLEIFKLLKNNQPYTIYDWSAFKCLRLFLKCVSSLFAGNNRVTSSDILAPVENQYPGFSQLMKELRLEEILTHCLEKGITSSQRIYHFHIAFDALKTLRFIHLIEKAFFPKKPWYQVLEQVPYMDFSNGVQPKEALLEIQLSDERLTHIIQKAPESFNHTHHIF